MTGSHMCMLLGRGTKGNLEVFMDAANQNRVRKRVSNKIVLNEQSLSFIFVD